MRLNTIYTIFYSLLALSLIGLFSGYSFGPAATVGMGYTGAPGDEALTCGNCHSANAFGAVNISMTSEGNPPSYSLLNPTPIEITVTAAMGMPAGYGIQLIALNDESTPLDVTYSNLSANLKESVTASGRKYLEHNGVGTDNTFTFDFLPDDVPVSFAPEITFYVAATAVNGAAGNGGDSGSMGMMFTLQDKALAVQLADFTATSVREGIQLNWRTETEENNEYFAVEHSTNGTDFNTLKTINGAGTTQERQTYSYTHDAPVNGTNYYRLRMVEFDGKTTYSDVVVEKFYTFGTITAFPQPADQYATMYVNAAIDESAMLQVHDIAGRIVYAQSISLTSGENLIEMDCSDWVSGHYIITVAGEQLGEEITRFVVR